MFQIVLRLWKSRKSIDFRFLALVKIAKLLYPRYVFHWPQIAWWDHQGFAQYLAGFGETGRLNEDRRWMLGQLLRLVEGIPGDTAECGVFQGAGSYIICQATQTEDKLPRMHFMFDSFEGISAPHLYDGSYWTQGDLASSEEYVKEKLSQFTELSFQKGWIPSRFDAIGDRRFAFVHIDVDLYEPTRDSIAFFYPRMNPGGIIVCDDYGFTTCPGANRAIDEYLIDKPEKMIAMSSGGGFLIKGLSTSGSVL